MPLYVRREKMPYMFKKTFHGGVHPEEGKELARDYASQILLPKGDLVFNLSQHTGKPAKPLVSKGDKVLAGQLIAEADGFISANVLSSCSGTVKAIEKRPTIMGNQALSIIMENDGKYTLASGIGKEVDYMTLTNEEIVGCVKAAGIIGMGGAGFPTHVKLMPKDPQAIRYVIANGAECEPYVTCDDRLMREHPEEIVDGVKIILRLFPHAQGVIVIEENKPEAIEAMEKACADVKNISVHRVETKYPQGGERSIMAVIAGKHIRLGMLPADAGCIVENVGTVRAIYRAVSLSEPLMERGVTVSGDGVNRPCNLIVKIGTSFEEILEAAGGFKDGTEPEKLICGGPMMGIALAGLDVSLGKNNNALTVFVEDPDKIALKEQTECLRCGRCIQVCPLGLAPQMMAVAAKKKDYERYEKKLYGLECISCGSCTFICPARRPLMQMFKQAKAEITAAKRR